MQQPTSDTKARLKRLQSDLLIYEANLKKKIAEKQVLLMEITSLRRQKAGIEAQVEDKERHVKKIESDELMLNNDIKSLRKKINLL